MYRLIALDIDGTLLNSRGRLTDATVAAVQHAANRGVYVTVCTGRSLWSAVSVVQRLSLNAPYVLNNGALIYDVPFNRARYIQHLPKQLAKRSVKLFRSLGLHPIVYGPLPEVQYFYYDALDPDNNSFKDYATKNVDRVHMVDDVSNFILQDVTCVSCDDHIERIKATESYIKQQLPGTTITLEISPWDQRYCHVTVMPAGVNKGNGLRQLSLLLGIELAEVIAIGDNLNDLEMLTVAGLGVAMGNGTPEVKEQANYITTSVDEEGVARVIERYIP